MWPFSPKASKTFQFSAMTLAHFAETKIPRLFDFNVNIINARLRLRVVCPGVPSAGADYDIAQTFYCNTAPVLWRSRNDCTATAGATKLVEKSLLPAILGSDDVRTHFTNMIFVGRDNLLFVQDGVSDDRVICTTHGEASIVVVKKRTNGNSRYDPKGKEIFQSFKNSQTRATTTAV
jgi:hypothetical protein